VYGQFCNFQNFAVAGVVYKMKYGIGQSKSYQTVGDKWSVLQV